jgi:hypothetical protein
MQNYQLTLIGDVLDTFIGFCYSQLFIQTDELTYLRKGHYTFIVPLFHCKLACVNDALLLAIPCR